MLRGFYTAASGMIAQQRRTEMLTNNISNANTPGYKADQSSLRAFPEMLLSSFDQKTVSTKKGLQLPVANYVGALNTGVYTQETIPAFKQGDIQETQNSTDIALVDQFMPVNGENGEDGSIFFSVRGEQGAMRYTRNGNFTVDQQGYLTIPTGQYVLGASGQSIQVGNDAFTIDEEGNVFAQDGRRIDSLRIAFAANPYNLIKEGNGLYRLSNEGQDLPLATQNAAVQYSVKQGFLERSNVDASRSMTDMMTAYRAFEANQKVLQAFDRSLEKTVNEVGKV
ncbi:MULTISPECIES: flagellar hook-basal body protein [Bacillus]|uniref:flagellar hook-basal body protein n=1 Tax=Bacillus TaxID=1386 RepID=UPI000367E842|nr:MULTISPECIES: flagellar hook-basal body protein [Bacillus]